MSIKRLNFSRIIISSAFGTDGGGIPGYNLLPHYAKLLFYARKTQTCVITKAISQKSRVGNVRPFRLLNPFPFIISARKYVKRLPDGGIVNAYNLTNEGMLGESRKILKNAQCGIRIIPQLYVGFSGNDLPTWLHDFSETVCRFKEILADYFFASELSYHCPNNHEEAILNQAEKIRLISESIRVVKKNIPKLGLIVKLAHNDSMELAKEIELAGADCIHAVNTIPFKDVYPDKQSPLDFCGGGSVSGPPIKPFSFKYNKRLRKVSKLHLIMGGGVGKIEDVRDFLDIGADSVSCCTAATDNTNELIRMIEIYN